MATLSRMHWSGSRLEEHLTTCMANIILVFDINIIGKSYSCTLLVIQSPKSWVEATCHNQRRLRKSFSATECARWTHEEMGSHAFFVRSDLLHEEAGTC